MQKQFHEVYKNFEKHYETLIVQSNSSQNVFQSILKAAFAKSYEFNCTCNNLSNIHDAFFLMASLRGICEDLISMKFIKEKLSIDREQLISLLIQKEIFDGIVVQRSFFKQNKSEQIILDVENADAHVEDLSNQIKVILKKNGLKGDKEFPSVAQMACDTRLIKLYDYLYYATSKLVHFTPGLLMKLGWADSLTSTTFKFSTKNFNKYYYDFCSYYGTFLFIEFYKAFKKDLGLDKSIKSEIKRLSEIMDDQLRIPELITFEECNVKPPSVITQLLINSSHRLKNK